MSDSVPRPALLGAAAVVLLSVGLAAAARRAQHHEPAAGAARAEILLRFADRADGAIVATRAGDGAEVAVFAPRTNGFVRGVLRGLFRARRVEALGRDAPFRLARGGDGRLIIEDPLTGRRVDLESFGPTNAAAFAGLLPAVRP